MNTTHLVPWNWFRRDSRIAPARGRVISGPVMPLYTEFDRLFDSLFNPEFQPALVNGSNTQLGESVIRPNLDISGDDKNYYVSVEVPGVEAKDLHVEVENDTLRIRGEKKYAHETKAEAPQEGDDSKAALAAPEKSFYRIERSYGSFERLLALPEDVDAAAIAAEHKDGVLTVTLPRKEEVLPESRRIEISRA